MRKTRRKRPCHVLMLPTHALPLLNSVCVDELSRWQARTEEQLLLMPGGQCFAHEEAGFECECPACEAFRDCDPPERNRGRMCSTTEGFPRNEWCECVYLSINREQGPR